jgi:hypothetical protein
VNNAKELLETTNQTARFRTRKLDDLCKTIILFFEKHPLQRKKKIEFERFREPCYLLKQKVHLKEEGFQKCFMLANQIPFDQKKS